MRYKTRKIEMYEVIDTETDEIMHRAEDRDLIEQHKDELNEQHENAIAVQKRIAAGEDLSQAVIDVSDSAGANDSVG